jgi:hypothetical protein
MTCIKSKEGPSQCTYSNGHLDTEPIMRKLNYLESIISTIAPHLLQKDDFPNSCPVINGTDCQLASRKRKRPDTDPSIQGKLKDLKEVSIQPWYNSFANSTDTLPSQPFERKGNVHHSTEVNLSGLKFVSEPFLTEPLFDFNSFVTSMNGDAGESFGNLLVDPVLIESALRTSYDPYFSNLSITNFPSLNGDLESHLVSLSCLFYVGMSPSFNMKSTMLVYRSHPFSKPLIQAICYHACFLSNHPMLFPTGNPTLKTRIDVAKQYSLEENCITEGIDNISLCDTIRAMLIHAITQYGIGNGMQSTQILGIILS